MAAKKRLLLSGIGIGLSAINVLLVHAMVYRDGPLVQAHTAAAHTRGGQSTLADLSARRMIQKSHSRSHWQSHRTAWEPALPLHRWYWREAGLLWNQHEALIVLRLARPGPLDIRQEI